MLKLNQKGALDPVVIVLLIIVLAMGGYIGYAILNKDKEEAPAEITQANQQEMQSETSQSENSTTSTAEKTVLVTGDLSFASESVPQDYEMCAVNIETTKSTCTSDTESKENSNGGQNYYLSVSVVPGEYYVYAKSDSAKHLAYYVDCNTYNCDSATELTEEQKVVISESGADLRAIYAKYDSFEIE